MKLTLGWLISVIILLFSSGPALAATRFVFIGHVYPRQDQLKSIIQEINSARPDFIVFGGDVIPGQNSHLPVEQQWQQFFAAVQTSRAPTFFVPGNHDLEFDRHFSNLPFAFSYRGSRYLFIETNSPGYPNEFDLPQETVDFIRWQTVGFDGRIFLFLHHAVWLKDEKSPGINAFYPAKNWPEVENLLKGKQAYVLAGDGNQPLKQSGAGVNYLVSGVTEYLSTEPAEFIIVDIDDEAVNLRSVVLPRVSWYKRLLLILANQWKDLNLSTY